jgi:phage-related tail fiber protein
MAETITYPALLTNQGLAKIAAAIANSTTVSLATIAVGDGNGNPTTPVATQTALVRATSVQAISRLTYSGTQATCEALFPFDDGGYTIREFGVFDTDGVLIAVGATPDLPKPATGNGAVEHIQRVVFDVGNASAVTVEIDPSILLASRQWVIDNYGLAVRFPAARPGRCLPSGQTLTVIRMGSIRQTRISSLT